MRTLSDELDVSLNISTLTGDYVVTQIYHNSVGVFSGQSYKGDSDTITFNLNDIVSQNRGKDDYLKLNKDKELDCVPMRALAFGTHTVYSRFDMGQIGRYRVWASDGTTNVQTDYENILSGYDYENKDIRPSMIVDNYDTELCRIMQGCNWYDNSEDEVGSFQNLLIPRVPAKPTNKFGIGLQLYHYNADGYTTARYSIRATLGRDVSLGAVWGKSNQTLLRLSDLYWNGISWPSTEDSSLFLKYETSSGDEFGDWEEGWTEYRGLVSASEIRVLGQKNGAITDLGVYEYGATYLVYMERYIRSNPSCRRWNWSQIRRGNLVVYTTDWNRNVNVIYNETQDYKDSFERVEIPRSSQAELQYDHLYAEPVFSETLETREFPDKFIGTCPVAILEGCYARYYLAWNDRYGDIQSQPFDGKIEFSEEIKTDEIMDYKQRRKVSHKAVQPKWKLNTKWLNEDIYPMYEAIFTSPYLLLYDTEQDKAWNVIITNSEYKQKTHKTEKGLFNLEIEVEANQKQNMTY